MAAGANPSNANRPIYGPSQNGQQGQIIGYYDSNGVPYYGATSAAQANARASASNAITPASTNAANATNNSGGGTAGTTPNSTTTPGGQTPMTGFASQYAPGMTGQVWDDPTSVLYDVFGAMGVGGDARQAGGIYQTLADFRGADPASLFFLQTGGGQNSLANQSDASYINWLAAQYQNQALAGGQAFDFQNLANSIFSQGNSDDNASVLYNLITAGTPTQQVSNVYNLLRDAGRVSMNDMATSAMLTALQRQASGYLSDSMRGVGQGGDMPFYQYLNQTAPGLVGALTGR